MAKFHLSTGVRYRTCLPIKTLELMPGDEVHYAENQGDRQNAWLRHLLKILSQIT